MDIDELLVHFNIKRLEHMASAANHNRAAKKALNDNNGHLAASSARLFAENKTKAEVYIEVIRHIEQQRGNTNETQK